MDDNEINPSRLSSIQEDLLHNDLSKYTNPEKSRLAVYKNMLDVCELRFEKWHISTPSGSAQKNLKRVLTLIWNSDRMVPDYFYELLNPIEDRFQIKFAGQQYQLYEHTIAFLDTNTHQPILFKASKFRGSSLQSIAAAKISSELNNIEDIKSIVKQGLIPAQLENLLMKYL